MDIFDSDGKSIFDAAPKKKKRYVLFIFHLDKNSENRVRTVEKGIQNTLPDHTLIRFEDPNEGLKALLVKNIEMVFIDHSIFDDDQISVEYASECKKRKKCPLFFVAKNENILIQTYKKKLSLYEEFDDYFKEPIDFFEMCKKIKRAAYTNGRKAKRFYIDIPIKIYRLNSNTHETALLNELSLVGFGIKHDGDDIFIMNEQVRINIPLAHFKTFHSQYGEFLPLSGKVKRISIDGQHIGFSIEHLTSLQTETLMNVLEKLNRTLEMIKISEPVVKAKDPFE